MVCQKKRWRRKYMGAKKQTTGRGNTTRDILVICEATRLSCFAILPTNCGKGPDWSSWIKPAHVTINFCVNTVRDLSNFRRRYDYRSVIHKIVNLQLCTRTILHITTTLILSAFYIIFGVCFFKSSSASKISWLRTIICRLTTRTMHFVMQINTYLLCYSLIFLKYMTTCQAMRRGKKALVQRMQSNVSERDKR